VAERALPLDSDWLRAHPLPVPDNATDKNGRGRVLAIGGGRTVPGGILLTVEAALRAGAGKIQVGAPASLAIALGIAMPEIAVFGLPENELGEIALHGDTELNTLIARCDCLVAGPAMSDPQGAEQLAAQLLRHSDARMVLDAALLINLGKQAAHVRSLTHPAVLTPHIGEISALLDQSAEEIDENRLAAVRETSERFGAICALKGATTLIAAPDGSLFAYAGGGAGLATGGSGDVLAGIVAGLCARGADPLRATLWAVWLHGEAGRRCAEKIGSLGFLARDLLADLPRIMQL